MLLDQAFKKYESEFEKAVEHTKQELASLRTGRAKPSLIENLIVEAYGSRMRIRELATISAPEPNMLIAKPWDQNIISDIEKALVQSELGLNPSREGEMIRIKLPDLSQERREQLVRVLHDKLEQSRIAVRGLRDKLREEILSSERKSEISEDEKFRSLEELDKVSRSYVGRIDTLGEEKEKEIKGN